MGGWGWGGGSPVCYLTALERWYGPWNLPKIPLTRHPWTLVHKTTYLDTLGSNGTRLYAGCHFTGLKKVSISRAQPPPTCPRNGCCPHQKHYARGRSNHRCINSYGGVSSVPGDQLFGVSPVGGAADPPPPRSAGPGSWTPSWAPALGSRQSLQSWKKAL